MKVFKIQRITKSGPFLVILFGLGTFYSFMSYELIHHKRQRGRLDENFDLNSNIGSHFKRLPSTRKEQLDSNLISSKYFLYEESYIIKGNFNWNGNLQCQSQGAKYDTSYLLLKNFMEETEWREDGVFNIFLTETSCNSKPNYRVWCSIESMARQNPGALVWYVMTSPEVDLQDGLVEELLVKYRNLRIVTATLHQIFNGTPLEELYHSGDWKTDTEWPAANLSDMLRLAIVWQAGGFYSDTDVICISSLIGLRNVIGLAEFNLVNGANFHFDRHHPMLEYFMVHLKNNFNPFVWGENGPQAVSAVLRDVCKEDILFQNLECEGVRILSHKAFNPVRPNGRLILFQKSLEKNITKRFPGSYIIHFWNKLTHSVPVFKNMESVYDLAAASFCPVSRETAIRNTSYY